MGQVKRITLCGHFPTGVSLKELAICADRLSNYPDTNYINSYKNDNNKWGKKMQKTEWMRKERHESWVENLSSLPLLTFSVSSFPVSKMKGDLCGPLTLDCLDCNPSAKTWRRVAVEFARGHPASGAWLVAAIPKKYWASPQRSAPPLPVRREQRNSHGVWSTTQCFTGRTSKISGGSSTRIHTSLCLSWRFCPS